MRFSAIILLLFAMLGCGSVSQPANDGDNKSQVADVTVVSRQTMISLGSTERDQFPGQRTLHGFLLEKHKNKQHLLMLYSFSNFRARDICHTPSRAAFVVH